MSCYVNTVNGPVSPRVYLKAPNAPGQRIFSRCAAPFFLEIRQYSCEKMSCSAQKFLAAGHIGSFQIHPKLHAQDVPNASKHSFLPCPFSYKRKDRAVGDISASKLSPDKGGTGHVQSCTAGCCGGGLCH